MTDIISLYTPIIVGLISLLLSGAGIWLWTVTNKVSRRELIELMEKKDEFYNKRFDQLAEEYKKADEQLSQKIEKERSETENLLRKEIQIIANQIEFVVSGINDIKDKIGR